MEANFQNFSSQPMLYPISQTNIYFLTQCVPIYDHYIENIGEE